MNKSFEVTGLTREFIDFLNNTSIEWDISGSEGDSGWCDMATGCRILSKSDVIVFKLKEEQEETLLRYVFGHKLIEVAETNIND